MLPPSIHGPLSHSLLILHRMASPHLGLLQHDPLSSQSSSLFIWRSASLLRLAEACACLTVFWLSKSPLAFPPLHILRIFQSLAWVALCTKPSWTPPGLNPAFFLLPLGPSLCDADFVLTAQHPVYFSKCVPWNSRCLLSFVFADHLLALEIYLPPLWRKC